MSDVQRFRIYSDLEDRVVFSAEDGEYVLFSDVEQAISDAVAAERRACARLVELMTVISVYPLDAAAEQHNQTIAKALAAIRARSGETSMTSTGPTP